MTLLQVGLQFTPGDENPWPPLATTVLPLRWPAGGGEIEENGANVTHILCLPRSYVSSISLENARDALAFVQNSVVKPGCSVTSDDITLLLSRGHTAGKSPLLAYPIPTLFLKVDLMKHFLLS